MTQHVFAKGAANLMEQDETVLGLAVAGSWLRSELDQYSDLDLVLVTVDKVAGDKSKMLGYAHRLGSLLSGFTGEHVGEPRLLICLYDHPLLHVDIKFVTLEEFRQRDENPVILLDKGGQLSEALGAAIPTPVRPDFNWIEERVWTWVHYALLKIGRGELFEALDFLGFMRMAVLGPLLQSKHDLPNHGVRKVEMNLPADDLAALKATIPEYDRASLLHSLEAVVDLYRALRAQLYPAEMVLQQAAEEKVMQYFELLKQGNHESTVAE